MQDIASSNSAARQFRNHTNLEVVVVLLASLFSLQEKHGRVMTSDYITHKN